MRLAVLVSFHAMLVGRNSSHPLLAQAIRAICLQTWQYSSRYGFGSSSLTIDQKLQRTCTSTNRSCYSYSSASTQLSSMASIDKDDSFLFPLVEHHCGSFQGEESG